MKTLPKPPIWADRFLQWFVDEQLLEEIQGDLHEAYYYRAKTEGLSKAKWLFITDVFRFFRPYAFEKYSNAKQFLPMFKNYYKIALRNILHRKQFTAINLLGLSVGISAVLLIGLYLQNEWTYDQHVPDYEQTFRLVNKYRDQTYANMPYENYYGTQKEAQKALVKHLESYDQVHRATNFVPSGSAISGIDQYYVKVNNREHIQQKLLFTNTGASFLELFPQNFLLGAPDLAFDRTKKVILTESMASCYFGTNWRQQEILNSDYIFRDQVYQVGGVVKDAPSNQHFDFEVILHQDSINCWGAYTYFQLTPSSSIVDFMPQLNQDIDKVYPGYTEDELSKGVEAIALKDIHFTSGLLYELKPTANRAYLWTFAFIGFIILLIIWTNYTNLSIAMYADRQRELGMRKVLGARGKDIGWQILIEAVLLTLLAMPIALGLLAWTLPTIASVLDLGITNQQLFNSTTLVTLFGILVLTGIFSSLYPAIVYGQKSISRLFKVTAGRQSGRTIFNFRNSLVGTQFVLLVGLMSITIYIHQQMDYIANREMGFEKEGVVFFGVNGAKKYRQMKQQLLQLSEVETVGSGMIPGHDMYNQLTYKMKESGTTMSNGTYISADLDAFRTLSIDCAAFDKLQQGQEEIFIINQTAARQLASELQRLPTDLVGETLILEPEWENEEHGFGIPYPIAGIIEDYDYFSLKYATQPLLISVREKPQYAYDILLKLNSSDWRGTMQQIEEIYASVETERPFDYTFLDSHLQALYETEEKAGWLMSGLSLVAIILAMVGLAGIVSYIALNRRKEISIRRVFGASTKDVLWAMNRDFVGLMVIATILAAPLAVYLTNRWLADFAFHISTNPLVIIVAGIVALLLVIIVVSWQTRRAIAKNPIELLRN
ncbi:MAG: FtsX-like permease family protein [Bacteroidota bacterium]